jgi:hypothetical protein
MKSWRHSMTRLNGCWAWPAPTRSPGGRLGPPPIRCQPFLQAISTPSSAACWGHSACRSPCFRRLATACSMTNGRNAAATRAVYRYVQSAPSMMRAFTRPRRKEPVPGSKRAPWSIGLRRMLTVTSRQCISGGRTAARDRQPGALSSSRRMPLRRRALLLPRSLSTKKGGGR